MFTESKAGSSVVSSFESPSNAYQKSEFASALMRVLSLASRSFPLAPIDEGRFGTIPWNEKIISQFKALAKNCLANMGMPWRAPIIDERIWASEADSYWAGMERTYESLDNKTSKQLLLQLLAYRILGEKHVALPLNTPQYWRDRKKCEALENKKNRKTLDFMNWNLYEMDLSSLGFPLSLFSRATSVQTNFLVRQYDYVEVDGTVQAAAGDVVFDGGACWGENALLFGYQVGPSGKVFSFEFVSQNLDAIAASLQLNPLIAPRIEVVNQPLGAQSGQSVFSFENGPGTRVSAHRESEKDRELKTVSIDDFVLHRKLSRVDMIKLDIEGAELDVLQGAIQTLRAYRPKLAISVYHRPEDLYTIPDFLQSLDLGYRFYLKHSTTYGEETILFCRA